MTWTTLRTATIFAKPAIYRGRQPEAAFAQLRRALARAPSPQPSPGGRGGGSGAGRSRALWSKLQTRQCRLRLRGTGPGTARLVRRAAVDVRPREGWRAACLR